MYVQTWNGLLIYLDCAHYFSSTKFSCKQVLTKSWLQVVYETNGFLEKNRDLLHADLLQLLASCDCALPQLFGASIGEDAQKLLSPTRRANGGTESQKQSVAAKFKVWFNLLRHSLFQAFQYVCIILSSSCSDGVRMISLFLNMLEQYQ